MCVLVSRAAERFWRGWLSAARIGYRQPQLVPCKHQHHHHFRVCLCIILVAYCSNICQKQAWKEGHKGECRVKEAQVTVASNSERAVLHSNRAAVYIQEKSYSLALEDAYQAITLDKTCARAYQRQARSFLELERFTEALLSVRRGRQKSAIFLFRIFFMLPLLCIHIVTTLVPCHVI